MSINVPKVIHGATALAAAAILYASTLPAGAQSAERKPDVFALVQPGAPVKIVPRGGREVSVFPSVQQAVTWVEQNKTDTEVGQVTVGYGTYRERVVVTKPNMWLRGGCRISPCESATNNPYDVQNANSWPSGFTGYRPFPTIRKDDPRGTGSLTGAATLHVGSKATGFFMKNMEIQNLFRPSAVEPKTGKWPTEQVAVAAAFEADQTVIRDSRFKGRQDTLLLDRAGCQPGTPATDYFPTSCTTARYYVADSYIEGTVDFIFGAGAAVFNGVRVMALPLSPLDPVGRTHVILAPRGIFPLNANGTSTQPNGFYHGFVFHDSFFNARNDIGANPKLKTPATPVYLGRPWMLTNNPPKDPKGNPLWPTKERSFSKVVLINSTVSRGRILEATPWQQWFGRTANFSMTTLLQSNVQDTQDRRYNIVGMRTMTQAEVDRHSPQNFLRGGGAVPLWDLNAAPNPN